jgi:hypothetical protein
MRAKVIRVLIDKIRILRSELLKTGTHRRGATLGGFGGDSSE